MGCLWTFFLAILTFVLVAGGTWCAMICEVPLWEILPCSFGYVLGKDGAIQWAACLYGFFGAYFVIAIRAVIAETRSAKSWRSDHDEKDAPSK